jgi:hypothetical protein
LFTLKNLEEIRINPDAYNALPDIEREHFTPENNSDSNAVHVYGVSPLNETDSVLELKEQAIDSFDFLNDYPKLRVLTIINCDIAEGLALPKIESLYKLEIIDTDVLELIKNNSQLSGSLSIGTYIQLTADDATPTVPPLKNLAGLETFTALEELSVLAPVSDISALSNCANLRRLSLVYSRSIDTLNPLYELIRLRYLYIDYNAFQALPEEERERFWNREKLYLPLLEYRD